MSKNGYFFQEMGESEPPPHTYNYNINYISNNGQFFTAENEGTNNGEFKSWKL